MTAALLNVIQDQVDEARMAAMRMVGDVEDRTRIMVALLQLERLKAEVPVTVPEPEPVADEGEAD